MAESPAPLVAAHGTEHAHPDDIAYATDVDRFAFAMEVEWIGGRPCLFARRSVDPTI